MCFQMISVTDMTKAALEQLVPHRPICLGKTYADRTDEKIDFSSVFVNLTQWLVTGQ